MTTEAKCERLKILSKEVWEMRHNDSLGMGNYFFEQFIEFYVAEYFPEIVKQLDFIIENNGEEKSYGDIDWTIKLLVNTPEKKVLYLNNHVSCADETEFLIIRQSRNGGDEIHFRELYRKAAWNKLSLAKAKKEGFKPQYGDCRDNGYLLSAKRIELGIRPELYFEKGDWRFDEGMEYKWGPLNRLITDIMCSYE